MPSVVNGEHMKAVKKYFDKLKIPVSGCFPWQLTLTLTLALTLALTLTLTLTLTSVSPHTSRLHLA